MTILRKCAALVAVMALAALAAPAALADYEPGLNPELMVPRDISATYDGPRIPNALLARYIVFPTHEQKRRLIDKPPRHVPGVEGATKTSAADGGQNSPAAAGGLTARSAERGSAIGIGGGLLTPHRGVSQPTSRIVDELEDALRDAQSELGLR